MSNKLVTNTWHSQYNEMISINIDIEIGYCYTKKDQVHMLSLLN